MYFTNGNEYYKFATGKLQDHYKLKQPITSLFSANQQDLHVKEFKELFQKH